MSSSSESTPRAAEDRLPALLERIERREQSARRRFLLYALFPVGLTVVLLGYTSVRVKQAQQQVQSLEIQIAGYKKDVTELQTALGAAEKKLAAATDLGQYVRPINFVEAKELASRFPGSEMLLLEILELRQRGVGWKLGGQSPQEGFDSPSFAMYILRQLHASGIEARPDEPLLNASRRLYEGLPPVSSPKTGDLVFYPAGYALFYFEDPREGPFVLGMTPFGITALKPDFSKPVGYRHVERR